MISPGYQCAQISCVSTAGLVIESSDYGSSVNDAEGLRSRIRTLEFQFQDRLAAEKLDREMERAEYEAQLAAKEAQNLQYREQYAQEKFELEQRFKHLELERQKLLNHVLHNHGYPTPSYASQLEVSNPQESWYEGSRHHLDTISDISHCPDGLYNSQNHATLSFAALDLVCMNEVPKSPLIPTPRTPTPSTPTPTTP